MTTLKSIAFIINPNSGTDKTKALQKLIYRNISEKYFSIKIIYTKYAGEAKELAKILALQNTNIVVAVGGDGTVNEVANGLLNTKTLLGILPKGSGNGLARACGIPLNTTKALQLIANGNTKKIDVGMANNKIFVSNTGVGFDAHVAHLCKKESNRGIKMYFKKSVQAFWNYMPENYLLEIDGKKYNEKAFMISVANGNEFGYGFKIAPTAKLDDGLLDIMIIEPLTLYAATGVTFNAWRGNLHKHNKVKHFQGKEIKITNYKIDCYQIDGDAIETSQKVEISILKKALNIIVK